MGGQQVSAVADLGVMQWHAHTSLGYGPAWALPESLLSSSAGACCSPLFLSLDLVIAPRDREVLSNLCYCIAAVEVLFLQKIVK